LIRQWEKEFNNIFLLIYASNEDKIENLCRFYITVYRVLFFYIRAYYSTKKNREFFRFKEMNAKRTSFITLDVLKYLNVQFFHH